MQVHSVSCSLFLLCVQVTCHCYQHRISIYNIKVGLGLRFLGSAERGAM